MGQKYADGVFNALYPGNVPVKYFYTGKIIIVRDQILLTHQLKLLKNM